MITEIRIPFVGVNDAQAVVLEWFAQDGATVKKDQELCVIETSKITQSVTADRMGILRLLAKPGEEFAVNAVIGWIADRADERADVSPAATTNAPVEATRKARELAEQLGIRLQDLPQKGLIREQDVRNYAQAQGMAGAVSVKESDLPVGVALESIDHSTKLGHAQLLIKDNMVQSLRENATACITMEAEVAKAMAAMSFLTQTRNLIVRLNDFFVLACARALTEHPGFNGFFWNDSHHFYRGVHMGVAIGVEETLVVPVIRDADKRSLADIAAEAMRLEMSLMRKTLKPSECVGSTFTLTNLGSAGVLSFAPIINSHQAAILGIGCLTASKTLYASLSFDHRLHNGVQAAQFLKSILRNVDEIAAKESGSHG
jgi:pyruvate dehydrogenase E2 component (dihydrolipoamide acetyltransferase)